MTEEHKAAISAARSAQLPTPLERFHNGYILDPQTDCWNWKGTKQYGYGSFSVKHKTIRAYRWSYENFIGPVPEGLEIDHTCDNRACVNPAHLEAVTHAENQRRRPDRKGRSGKTKLHGPEE